MFVHKLVKPVVWFGETVESLNLDFEALTGADCLAARAEAAALTNPKSPSSVQIPIPALDMHYQMAFAARAAKVSVELIRLLGAADFTTVTVAAAGFLLSGD